jgi:alpha-N-arabinofuranosidase
VCLGIRPQGGRFHHLGRETFLAPVTWSDGWPVIGADGTLELEMPAPQLPPHPWPAPPVRDDFDAAKLGLAWNFLRNPRDEDWSLTERPGFLRLRGSAVTLRDQDSPAFVGRRQTALVCRAAAQLDFAPGHENEEAGLVVRGNDKHHVQVGVTLRDGRRQAFLRRVQDGKVVEPVHYEDIPDGAAVLSIDAQPLIYEFFVESVGGPPISLGTTPTQDLSSEKIVGFTGVYFGMFATGNGRPSTAPADFDWFEYHIDQR